MVALFTPNHPRARGSGRHELFGFSMPPRSSSGAPAAGAPTGPRLPSYAHAASRTALALITSEARAADDDPARFDAIERSASEALLDIFTRYMRAVGTASRATAQHAARSQCNLADVLVGISSVHAGSAGVHPGELLAFLEEAPEVAFPVNLSSAFPAPRESLDTTPADSNAAASTDARPAHLPDFLPPLPEKRTYMHTHVHNSRPSDGTAARKKKSKHRRQAQDSLFAAAEAEDSRAANGAGGASGAGPPPPPLPVMPTAAAGGTGPWEEAARETAADERAAAESNRRNEGVESITRFPDVLAPGQPAVLQSSARFEASGIAPPAGGASGGAARGGGGGGAGAGETRPLQDAHKAILGLKHMHGLDRVETSGNAGGD